MNQLLLISSSRTYGTGFLDHCETALVQRLAGVERLMFAPYALYDRDAYAELARARFQALGVRLESLHRAADPAEPLQEAEALFVGGGNSFRLLRELYQLELLDLIRQRVAEGMIYIGSSAGTNMACPTIRTTNDMPIVEPPSLMSLGLVPFQINPHYLDAPADEKHQGETREQRLREYLEENNTPVLALREGAWLFGDGDHYRLGGSTGGRLFAPDELVSELPPNAQLVWRGQLALASDP